jgi:DNA-binding FrmR family transcriptional regulator
MSSFEAKAPGYLADKSNLLRRLARVEGQVRGIARMVDDERSCLEILTQLSAADRALSAVGLSVLDQHVRRCMSDALRQGDPLEAQLRSEELLEAVQRFTRTH